MMRPNSESVLEAEVQAEHGLRRVREGALGAELFQQARPFIHVAPVLQAQAQVRQQTPVNPGAIDKHACGLRIGRDVCRPLFAGRAGPDARGIG